MNKFLAILILFATTLIASVQENKPHEASHQDMLSPQYYQAATGATFKTKVDKFISASRKKTFHHPLQKDSDKTPRFSVKNWGKFGAGKGPGKNKSHHPAVDFQVGNRETNVTLYATYDGRVTTFRNAPKFRHYLALTKNIVADNGDILGKIVTVYAHLDLDLDKASGLSLDGAIVKKGDTISKHLYAGTKGGPHLHFEIRYYRPKDKGDETFYGFNFRGNQSSGLTQKSAGPWHFGTWNPNIGYGFADPRNHGVSCY